MSLEEFDTLKWDHSCSRLDQPSKYLLRKARKNPNGLAELRNSLNSCTIYVGNLSFYTSEEQIYELFSKCGQIKRIVMGLDRFKFTPCGFCFVIFSSAKEAMNAIKYLSNTKLDEKIITIDLDPGFEDGRQFGRGKSGGQVSDELRFEFDAVRGGFGVSLNERIGQGDFITRQRFNNHSNFHKPTRFNNGSGSLNNRVGKVSRFNNNNNSSFPTNDQISMDQDDDNYIPQ